MGIERLDMGDIGRCSFTSRFRAGRQGLVKRLLERVWRASNDLGNAPGAAFTRSGRHTPVGSAAARRASPTEKKEPMPDLAYLALTVVCFIALALVVKAVEKL